MANTIFIIALVIVLIIGLAAAIRVKDELKEDKIKESFENDARGIFENCEIEYAPLTNTFYAKYRSEYIRQWANGDLTETSRSSATAFTSKNGAIKILRKYIEHKDKKYEVIKPDDSWT